MAAEFPAKHRPLNADTRVRCGSPAGLDFERPNGWRVSGERKRVRCTRVLGRALFNDDLPSSTPQRHDRDRWP